MSWTKSRDDYRTVTDAEKKRYRLKAIRDCPESEDARKDTNWYLATNRDGDLIKMQNPFSTYRHMKKDGTLWVRAAKKELLESYADRIKSKKERTSQLTIGSEDKDWI